MFPLPPSLSATICISCYPRRDVVGQDARGQAGGVGQASLHRDDPVGQRPDLGHLVGRVLHGDTLLAQDNAIEEVDLAVGDGRGGFVEQDHVRAATGGLDDLDDLL